MSHRGWTHRTQGADFVLWIMVVALIVSLASCKKSDESKPAAQRTFASPAEAGTALFEAAKSGDTGRVIGDLWSRR